MAIAPLRQESPSSWERPSRPRLVLEDCTQDRRLAPARPKTNRRVDHRWENLLFAAAAATVLMFFLVTAASSLYRSAAASYQSPLKPAVVLPVTVHSGDTLWTYAQKYGSSNVYILDRVEALARANRLAPDSALIPGQHLIIPVTDPVKIAQLENARLVAQR